MEALKALLNLLFLPDERCCPSTDRFAYHSLPVSELHTGQVALVSPSNKVPIKTIKTEDLILMAINPMKGGFRNDGNVSAFRTFLFELDVGSIQSQYLYFKKLEVPVSCHIFSGSKSVHTLVTLDQDIDEKTYRLLYQWSLAILTLADSACKNPSRSVRIPGAIRPETGKEQKLMEFNGKVKLEDFMTWLNKYPHLRPKEREERKNLTSEKDYDRLSSWLRRALKESNLDFSKGRNRMWYAVFYDFAKAGYGQEEAELILGNFFQEEHDFKEKEWLICAKSAYDHVLGNK
jgi:hypothetical protein